MICPIAILTQTKHPIKTTSENPALEDCRGGRKDHSVQIIYGTDFPVVMIRARVVEAEKSGDALKDGGAGGSGQTGRMRLPIIEIGPNEETVFPQRQGPNVFDILPEATGAKEIELHVGYIERGHRLSPFSEKVPHRLQGAMSGEVAYHRA